MAVSVSSLLESIEASRARLNSLVADLDRDVRPAGDGWSVADILEHLVLAERMGVHRIWRAAEATRSGRPVWTGVHVNGGLSIEEIVARTWQSREVAPDGATPTGRGGLPLWRAELQALTSVTATVQQAVEGLRLTSVIDPHFLSGPLDAGQRLEFIRFHIDRHRDQIAAVLREVSEPHPADTSSTS